MASMGQGPDREDAHAADAHHVGGGHDHDHESGHDHADAHAEEHEGEALGPIDWLAWGAGALGIALSLVIAAVFYAAAT
jgi:hypothetical protein